MTPRNFTVLDESVPGRIYSFVVRCQFALENNGDWRTVLLRELGEDSMAVVPDVIGYVLEGRPAADCIMVFNSKNFKVMKFIDVGPL